MVEDADVINSSANVDIDGDMVLRLFDWIMVLFERKRRGRVSHEVLVYEYWALKLLVSYYEIDVGLLFDNEDETLKSLRAGLHKWHSCCGGGVEER